MLLSLPWLPQPADAERQRFAELAAPDTRPDLAAWRTLLIHAWPEPGLRKAGQRIARYLTEHGGNQDLAEAGVVRFRLLVISSYTYTHMTDAIIASALRHGVALEIELVEYSDPASWLNNPANRADDFDGVLLATNAAGWRIDGGHDDENAALTAATDRAAGLLDAFTARGARSIIVQTLSDDLAEVSLHFDALLPGSRLRMVRSFNERLGMLAAKSGHMLLDVARLSHLVGADAWWAGRYWFSAKFPFALACIPLYGDNLGRILAAKLGKSRRVLVLDLDNTLWSGVIGDDGLDGIVIGQGSAAGEAHLAIQKIAKAYAARGVVLCVASKNTHDIAIEAFRNHPDMLLREADIAAFHINWQDKASNIRLLSEKLSLGLESFVFLDDNPVERKQVRDALPLVAIPELPEDPGQWPVVLAGAGYFEQISFTEEDRQRGSFYKSLAARSELELNAGDTSAFLQSLDTQLSIAPFDATGRKRIAQLISKSNQFNLTTRRYSEADVERAGQEGGTVTMQVRLSDMFGDAGMISVVIARHLGDALDIDLWLMSCRVLGRRVEEAVLHTLVERARHLGATKLTGTYIPSGRNGIVEDHYRRLNFTPVGGEDGETRWALALDDYAAPDLPMRIEDHGLSLETIC